MPLVPTASAGLPGTVSDGVAIDRFIQASAPTWLRLGTPEALARTHQSLRQHHDLQAQVARLLEGIEPLDQFAAPRLQRALSELLGTTPDVANALWREVGLKFDFPVFRVTDTDLPTARLYSRDSNFLPRALQNFSVEQTEAGYYYAGAGMVENGRLLALGPAQLAAECRKLDLGEHYQRHLDSVLEPGDGQERQHIVQLLADDQRCTLQTHACCSHLKGAIDDAALQQLLAITQPAPDAGVPGQWHSVQVLGSTVIGALLLELASEGGFVLYLPSDPRAPLRQQPSLKQLAATLSGDLKHQDYLDAFIRQFHRDDRPDVLRRLIRALEHAHPDLELVAQAPHPIDFSVLARDKIARIKADAALLAVPTAMVDEAAYQQRIKTLESIGVSAGSALAWFVPWVAELMFVGLIKDVLGEVYEGVDDWTHGQRGEAIDHLFALMGSLALGAAVGAGITVAAGAITRSFANPLVPVLRSDASARLWHRDLNAYQSPVKLESEPHSDGLWREHGREWWCRGHQVFEVREDGLTGRRRIVHPLRQNAHGPELIGNGDGAWWVVGEHPLHWHGVPGMLRRMGPRSAGLSDEACGLAADVAQVDESQLRGLLVQRLPMPGRLVSALERFALDARINHFFLRLAAAVSPDSLDQPLCNILRGLSTGQYGAAPGEELAYWRLASASLRVALFEHLDALAQPVLGPAGLAIRRSFPGLPNRAVRALVEDSTPQQQAVMEREGRIPLAVLEQARLQRAQWRVSRALEGLCLRNSCNTDCVRLVFALLRRLPGWPQGLSFELREATLSGRVLERLLPTSEASTVRVLLSTDGAFEVADDQARFFDMPEGAGSVFDAIVAGLSAQQCRELGLTAGNAAEALRGQLRESVWAAREQVASMLGLSSRAPSFRPPQRESDRRIGYPLSGRGAPGSRSLSSMVRTLFPGFNDLEASVFLEQLQVRSLDPLGELLRYQASLDSLDNTLGRWERQGSLFSRGGRRRVAAEIRRGWCRQNPPVLDTDGRVLGYRLRLDRIAVGDLPELPDEVDFSHIVDLSLSGAGQTQRVNGFLGRFRNLRWLDLSSNACINIPVAVQGMSDLRELVMSFNEIRLTDTSTWVLASLGRLEVLYLDNNPLGAAPDLSVLPRLRRVSLRRTGLRGLPNGLLTRSYLEMADLRDNQLVTLPDGFFESTRRVRDATLLRSNPLMHEVRNRLWELIEDQQLSAASEDAPRQRLMWLTGLEGDALAERGSQWDNLRQEPGSDAFFRLLGDLIHTAEYRYEGARLRARVWHMLEGATQSTELREMLFQGASVPTSCVDSVISSFSALELSFQVYSVRVQAPAGQQQQALLRLGRGLFRLDRLEAHVRTVIAARQAEGRGVDEIEVSLAYRIRLARELELPAQPHHMEYGEIASVSQRDLDEAAAVVRADDASDALAQSLASREFWLSYLREQHPARFSEMEDRYWTMLDEVTEQQGSTPEGVHVARLNQLAAEREAALNALALRFTRAALSASPGH